MPIPTLILVGALILGVETSGQQSINIFNVLSESVLAAKKCKGGKIWDSSKGKCTYPPSDDSRGGGGGGGGGY